MVRASGTSSALLPANTPVRPEIPSRKCRRLPKRANFPKPCATCAPKIPFPGVTGRVCPHFCMDNRNRSNMEGRASTRARPGKGLRRFRCLRFRPFSQPSRYRQKKIAIAGGGPAGLTSAYFSCPCFGHEATVYEARSAWRLCRATACANFRPPRYIVDRSRANPGAWRKGPWSIPGLRRHPRPKSGRAMTPP